MSKARRSLHRYQERKLAELGGHRRALATPYGSGKAVIVLNAMKRSLGTAPGLWGVVLSGTKNVRTWTVEIGKWLPSVRVYTEETLDLLEMARPDHAPGILIIRHHRIRSLAARLEKLRSYYWVMDESTVIKNPDAQITQLAIRMVDRAPSLGEVEPQRIIISGKLMPENELEVWSQFQFAYGDSNPFGTSFYKFQRRWFLKTDYDWVLLMDKREDFYRIVQDHTVLFDDDDMEEFTALLGIDSEDYVIEQYEETAEQRRYLDYLDENWALPAGDTLEELHRLEMVGVDSLQAESLQDEEYSHTIAILQKRQQIASGFYYLGKGRHRKVVRLRRNPKLELLKSLVSECLNAGKRRIVVWYKFREERELLLEELTARWVDVRIVEAEPADLDRFVTPGPDKLLAILPIKSARGLNDLVTAADDFYFSNEYSQELRDQAEKRIARLGQQERIVTHTDLCSPRQLDYDIVFALQTKNLTPARLRTIVRQRVPVQV